MDSILEESFIIKQGNCIDRMKELPDACIDMIFADPPYFLSKGGTTCQSGKRVKVDKGDWDQLTGQTELDFTIAWLVEAKRILKASGSIWISGTYHNIFTVGTCIQNLEFKILNNITWHKPNASPNLSCRYFTHSSESIIWATPKPVGKLVHTFNYSIMKKLNNNKQMRDVWEIPTTPKREKLLGGHPTQKPLALLERIVLASTQEGQLILDPFCGSGTTGVVALSLSRKFIGIELDSTFVDLSKRRIEAIIENKYSTTI